MKKTGRLRLAAVLLSLLTAAAVTACGSVTTGPADTDGDKTSAVEIVCRLSRDGASYAVTGTTAEDNDTVTELSVPASYEGLPVTEIADEAFSGYANLRSVSLPDSVTRIGERTFYNCPRLAEIELPADLTEIGAYAFFGCESIVTLTLGQNLTFIGGGAFDECEKLIEVCDLSGLDVAAGSDDNGYVGYYAENVCTDPDDSCLTAEGDFTYYDDGTVRYLVAYGGAAAELTLPEGNYTVYTGALRYTDGLQALTVPDGVTTIWDSAFAECPDLQTVTFGSGLAELGGGLFTGCPLENVHIGDIAAWCAVEKDGSLGVSGVGAPLLRLYSDGKEVRDLTIPDGVQRIESYSFFGFSRIRTLTFSDTVTYVGESAFTACYGLIHVTLGTEMNNIRDDAFAGCERLFEVENRSPLRIEAGADDRGGVALYAHNVYTPTDGESLLTKTDDGFTFYCGPTQPGVTTCYLVDYDGTETALVLPDAYLDQQYSIAPYVFYRNESIASAVVPFSIREVGKFAFAYCVNLSELRFPRADLIGNMNTIRDHAFYGCSLSRVEIPGGLYGLGDSAFDGNANLTEVIIPSNVWVEFGTQVFGTGLPLTVYMGENSMALAAAAESIASYCPEAKIYFYNETEPTEEGSYWHYVDDVPTAW